MINDIDRDNKLCELYELFKILNFTHTVEKSYKIVHTDTYTLNGICIEMNLVYDYISIKDNIINEIQFCNVVDIIRFLKDKYNNELRQYKVRRLLKNG